MLYIILSLYCVRFGKMWKFSGAICKQVLISFHKKMFLKAFDAVILVLLAIKIL